MGSEVISALGYEKMPCAYICFSGRKGLPFPSKKCAYSREKHDTELQDLLAKRPRSYEYLNDRRKENDCGFFEVISQNEPP